jgi:ribosomal-protein-alanine N-acetyltransferase
MTVEELRTTRLSLRRPTPADVDAILAVHSDSLACAHNPSDMLVTREEAADLFQRWDNHWQRHGFGYWVVRESVEPLGFCGVKLMPLWDNEILNLFYRFAPAAWGKGFASEAATAVVRWMTARAPDHPVIARVRPDNVASQRVAVNAGLARAPHLDTEGEDGLDWIYAANSRSTSELT